METKMKPRHERRSRNITRAGSAALALLLSACGAAGASDSEADRPEVVWDKSAFMAPPDVRQVGTCLDASGSVDPAVIDRALSELAKVPDLLRGDDEPSTPEPEVHFIVRVVDSESLSPRNELVNVTIPGVPGLADEPSIDAEDWLSAIEAHKKATAEIAMLEDAASKAIDDLESTISSVSLGERGSGIFGCVTKLVASLDQQTPITVLVVSDLDQLGVPQVHGDLSDVTMNVAHDCRDTTICDAQVAAWVDIWGTVGLPANQINIVAPERLSIVASQIMNGEGQ